MSDERMSIQESIHRMFWAVDERDWAEAARGLGKRVLADYSEVDGESERELTREELIQQWVHLLTGFDTTQHLLSAIRVQVDHLSALAYVHFQAHHTLGEEYWTLGGSYELAVEYEEGSWRITRMKVKKLWELGNPNLAKKAVGSQ